MIIWSKREGYNYESERTHKRYSLLEGMCYKGECTSDSIIIWDDENLCFANYVQGATFLHENIEELDKTIKQYVDEYEAMAEAKQNGTIVYPLTKAGVKAWSADVVDDICDRGICGDYIISRCNRQIKLPDLAEVHELLERFLEDAEEEANA